MNITTWNVNSIKVRLPQVLHWLQNNRPDVLAVQELKFNDDDFLRAELAKIGFQAAINSQKTYNGVALFSANELTDISLDIPNFPDEQKRLIAATVNNIRIINVYCVNGENLDSPKFQYKKQWFDALIAYIKQEISRYENLILLGDFNIAPADMDVFDGEKRRGKILCSDEERSRFQALLNSGLHDSLRETDGENQLFTWWDYRMNGFKRNLGMRIDHILLSDALMKKMQGFIIDREARAAERPSDHAPVTIQLA